MKKILLVEDDVFIRDLYIELLRDEGYQVDVATNGEEGYNLIRKGGYDLVLLDIMLPKLDALQILNKLKTNPPQKSNRHILFLTNLGQENIVKNGKSFGVDGYLIKSDLTPDQFLKKIAEYLNK